MAAGAPVGAEVHGLAETHRAFADLESDFSNLEETHRAAAEAAADRSRDLVPVVSGALRDTIHVEASKDGAEVLAGSATVPYAGVIEYGWPAHGIAAEPYLEPPLADPAQIEQVYQAKVDEEIRKFDRETP